MHACKVELMRRKGRAVTDRALASMSTLGRTGGGGTGSTVSTIQSGRAYFTLNPAPSRTPILVLKVLVLVISISISISKTPTFRSGAHSLPLLYIECRASAQQGRTAQLSIHQQAAQRTLLHFRWSHACCGCACRIDGCADISYMQYRSTAGQEVQPWDCHPPN